MNRKSKKDINGHMCVRENIAGNVYYRSVKTNAIRLIIYSHGTEVWYSSSRLHRLNGPAVIYVDGTEGWYKNGARHRDKGPAVILPNGTKEYWKRGILIATRYPKGSK